MSDDASSTDSTPPDDAGASSSSDAPASEDAGASGPDVSGPDVSGRGSWRKAKRLVGGALAVLVVTIGGLLLVLQTETGATLTAQLLADQLNPLPGTELTVDRAGGSWIGSIRLTGVRLTRVDSASGESVEMAAVDTLEAEYNLLPLYYNRLHVTRATIAGPSVTLRQAADSTWDWSRVLPASETDTSASAFSVRLDDFDVRRGGLAAQFYAGGRDSTVRVTGFTLAAESLAVGSSVAIRLDTLGLDARVPGDTTNLELAARGRLTPSSLMLDTLRLDSPRSRVRGGGTARLPTGPGDVLDDVDLRLRANPLSFRDLQALLPTLDVDPDEAIALDARITGSGRRLQTRTTARFTGGGTVDASATLTPTASLPAAAPDTARLRYRLDARVRNLTTSLLAERDPSTNRLSADLFADLQGRALDRLDGPVRTTLRDTRLFGLRTDSLALTATLRDGDTDFGMTGRLNGARVDADGQARLLDETPTYDVTARLGNVNVEAFAPASGLQTRLDGTVRANGSAFSGPDMELGLDVDLQPSRVENQVVSSARAALRLRPDSIHVDTEVTLPEGRLMVAGRADLQGSERFVVDTARVRTFDVAALVGDTTASSVTGTLQAQGRGFSPETMQLDGRLRLTDTYYGPYRVSNFDGRTSLANGALTTQAEAVVNGGTWTLAAESRPFAEPLTAAVTESRFRNVDLGAFAATPVPTDADTADADASVGGVPMSRLSGTLQASLRGTEPEQMQASLTVDLDSSRIHRQRLTRASLAVTLDTGTLTADLSLEGPTDADTSTVGTLSTAQFTATAQPFDAVPTYQLVDGEIQNLDVGALAGIPGLRAPLTGAVEAEGRGVDPKTLQATTLMRLDRSPVNRSVVTRGRLRLAADSGRAEADGELAFADGGRVRLSGTADSLDLTPSYTLSASAGRLDVGAVAGLDSTLALRADTLQWTLDGRGATLETLTAETNFATGPIQIDRVRVQTGRVVGRLDGGILHLDTLSVQSNTANAAGSGRLALTDTSATSDFDLVMGVTDARPLRRLLGADKLSLNRARAELHVYGPANQLRFDGQSQVRRFVYDDLRLADLQVQFNGAGGVRRGLEKGTLQGNLGFFSTAALSVENTRLNVDYDTSRLDVRTRLRLDRQRDAVLDARVLPHPGEPRFTMERLTMRLGTDEWQLLQPAEIDYADAYRVNGLLLYSGNQQIAADGVVDLTGPQNLIVTVEQFRMGTVTDLFGFSGLGGQLTGTIDLTGPATAPRLNARLDADVESENRSVGTLQLDVRYDSLRTRIDAELEHADGQLLTARGTVPTDLRLHVPPGETAAIGGQPVSIDVNTDSFPIDWVDPFVDPATVRDIEGTLQAGVQVRGTLDDPDLDGTAAVEGAGAYLPDLGVLYSRGTADVQFDANRAQVRSARIRSANGGRLEADGTVDFSDLTLGEFNLDVTARNFIGIDNRAYSNALVDGRFTLRGTTLRPVLNGTVEIKQADVYFTEATAASESDYAAVQLSESDQLALEERFGLRLTEADTTTFDAYQAMAMDLSVRIRGDTWLRSEGTPELNVQFSGDLDLEKEFDRDAQVFGTIEVVTRRSTIRQFGREFQIREGTLTFNGDPILPYLDLAAVYEQRAQGTTNETSVEITLSLEGRPDDLSPKLSSEPPMETRNILSYLATGKPADEILSGSGGGSLTESVPLGVAASFAENFAANRLGLDVVRFQYRSSGDWYLTVGQYLTPRFYVAAEQSVGSGFANQNALELVPDLTVEYQLTSFMQLRTVRRQSSLRLNVLFEYAY